MSYNEAGPLRQEHVETGYGAKRLNVSKGQSG